MCVIVSVYVCLYSWLELYSFRYNNPCYIYMKSFIRHSFYKMAWFMFPVVFVSAMDYDDWFNGRLTWLNTDNHKAEKKTLQTWESSMAKSKKWWIIERYGSLRSSIKCNKQKFIGPSFLSMLKAKLCKELVIQHIVWFHCGFEAFASKP